jgi:membrane protein YdbS with pleckstrin-like domain
MPQWRYRVHRWEATDTAVYTQTGWISQQRRIAPISRVQTVDSERGPIEQLFRLANVTVTTASAAGPIKIHGLTRVDADQLVADLTIRVGRTTGDAT